MNLIEEYLKYDREVAVDSDAKEKASSFQAFTAGAAVMMDRQAEIAALPEDQREAAFIRLITELQTALAYAC